MSALAIPLLWGQTSAGGAKVLVDGTYVASIAIPWGGRAVAGKKVFTKFGLDISGVKSTLTNLKVKITRTPVLPTADATMTAVDLATTSHKEGIAGSPQPIDAHVYTDTPFVDLIECDLPDSPCSLIVSVQANGTIGATSAVRAYPRWT